MPPYGSLCANVTLFEKPKTHNVHNVSQRRHRRIEQRTHVTRTQIEDRARSSGDMLADKQTDTLITTYSAPYWGRKKMKNVSLIGLSLGLYTAYSVASCR